MCGTKEILLKSWKKPHNLSPILAPADPWKSWKKPHNLRTITGTPEILEKNLTILRICLLVVELVVVPTSCAEAPCGGKHGSIIVLNWELIHTIAFIGFL